MEDTGIMQLTLTDCFELGSALRSGDADKFCEIYDSILVMDFPELHRGEKMFKVSVQLLKVANTV